MENPESVAGVIFSSQKKEVLLIKRRDVPVWVLPGGGIDLHESSEDAIVREILEETGFTVKVTRLIGDYIPINRLAKRTHLFECSISSGEQTLSEETKDIAFFPLEKLPLLPPPYSEWILDAQEKHVFLKKKISSVTYRSLFKHFVRHPLLVIRFLLSRIGIHINT